MSQAVDYFVIGGGSGGVRSARIAAGHGAKVAIAEESRYGGTCVIRGCVPKKFFVYASEYGHHLETAASYGWSLTGTFNWQTLLTNKDARIDHLNKLYTDGLVNAGVTVLNGRAVLSGPNEVVVNGTKYHAKHILIATGGTPVKLDIPGAELGITSNEAFHLDSLPKRIAIVGGGYIGLEFSSIFRGLGCEVTLVHHRAEALRGFDEDIRHVVTENLRADGVRLLFDTTIASIERSKDGLVYRCEDQVEHHADIVMFATGRRPNTDNLGLDVAGVQVGDRGNILINDRGQTSVPHIYAVGDCTDRLQLTPVAIREGHTVANNLFTGTDEPLHHATVPTAIFTQPPAATVGLTEAQARKLGDVLIYKTRFRTLFHSMTDRPEKVMMKLVVDKASNRVLGAHMVGEHAADIIQAAAIAVGMGATKADFDRTVALHPCTAEELVLMRTPES